MKKRDAGVSRRMVWMKRRMLCASGGAWFVRFVIWEEVMRDGGDPEVMLAEADEMVNMYEMIWRICTNANAEVRK